MYYYDNVFLFSGCSTVQDDDKQMNTSSNNTSAYIEKVKKMSDEEVLYNYINGLEVSLIKKSELTFSNSGEIPSQTLYMFFLYSLDSNKYNTYEKNGLKRMGNFIYL